ncbi:MarR family winged helix-turn-helix transcriptional regulator [Actinomadura rudentiformis]|uniref:MarR family transcriptional regulator n=1 Tax=Actinomadura rudentiformis TaxID=359158 RepID=A0A6H9YUN2_9ACTN|nr:MarR family transcriptional regulator [Actinomadura rudentiformis]KAB2348285.1 MarR family transcriptional regulator [Actinomadura rudentiformis]
MKPIGYWLNRTDSAITRYMDDMLDDFGLTRVVWQVLNSIKDETSDTELFSLLQANADVQTLQAAIDTTLANHWATRPSPDRLSLTPNGRAHLAQVAEHVDAFRERSMAGISQADYRTTISVLERMTHNLESEAPNKPAP